MVVQSPQTLLDVWPMGREFDLPRASVCIVAGAFEGNVMELLDEVYSPDLIVGFEPQRWAYEYSSDRLVERPNCLVVPYGISAGERGRFPMGEFHTDGCSFMNVGSRDQGSGVLFPMDEVLHRLRLPAIDLAVFNMEGYEYRLLPYIFEKGLQHRIDRFAVQFHTTFGDSETYQKIVTVLGSTHKLTIDDFPRWVYWRRI